jgi:hypothetical protein
MNRYLILVFVLFTVCLNVSAEIYKWKDENGVTHYGQRPPVTQKSEKIDIDTHAPSSTREIPSGAKEFAEGIMNAEEKASELNCREAVSNAQYSLDQMLENGRKNYKGGYIEKSQYDKIREGINTLKSNISFSDCQSASGNKKKFYTCVSSPYNFVASCGQKHPF